MSKPSTEELLTLWSEGRTFWQVQSALHRLTSKSALVPLTMANHRFREEQGCKRIAE